MSRKKILILNKEIEILRYSLFKMPTQYILLRLRRKNVVQLKFQISFFLILLIGKKGQIKCFIFLLFIFK